MTIFMNLPKLKLLKKCIFVEHWTLNIEHCSVQNVQPKVGDYKLVGGSVTNGATPSSFTQIHRLRFPGETEHREAQAAESLVYDKWLADSHKSWASRFLLWRLLSTCLILLPLDGARQNYLMLYIGTKNGLIYRIWQVLSLLVYIGLFVSSK